MKRQLAAIAVLAFAASALGGCGSGGGLLPEDVEPRNLSPLALAFVGDGVYELMVRERLVCQANRPVNELHKQAVAMVRAEAQAAAMDAILPG